MTVEQNVATFAVAATPVGDHHWLAVGGFDPRLEADLAQSVGAPLGGAKARLVIRRVGRDAWDGQKPEQPFEGRRAFRGEMIEHVIEHAFRRAWPLPGHSLVDFDWRATTRGYKRPAGNSNVKRRHYCSGWNA